MPNWSLDEFFKFHNRKKDEANSPSPDAELEQDPVHASYGEGEIPPFVRGEYTVRITSVRNRLLDDDDQAPKYFIDAIARARLPEKEGFFIIPGDAPWQVTSEIRQRKCRKGESEHIIIDVYPTAEGPSDEQP